MLGAVAFVGQGLLGAAIAMLGLFLLRATGANRYFAWAGVVIGAGWAIGALALEFGIIVPCTVLAWVWIAVLAFRLIRRRTA